MALWLSLLALASANLLRHIKKDCSNSTMAKFHFTVAEACSACKEGMSPDVCTCMVGTCEPGCSEEMGKLYYCAECQLPDVGVDIPNYNTRTDYIDNPTPC